jgi:hypothetical protein
MRRSFLARRDGSHKEQVPSDGGRHLHRQNLHGILDSAHHAGHSGIDLKSSFWPKTSWIHFHPQILDKFHQKAT